MKKNKTGILFAGLVFAFVAAFCVFFNSDVSAKASVVDLCSWNFLQDTRAGGFFGSIILSNGEVFTSDDIARYDENGKTKETIVTSLGPADGFDMEIEDNGSVKGSEASTGNINPYSLQAYMDFENLTEGNRYRASFTASATSRKYVYFDARSTAGPTFTNSIIVLDSEPQTYSITFTWSKRNMANANMRIQLMFGAFNSQYDYGGGDISDIVDPLETNWNGTVYLSDFTLEDLTSDNASDTDVAALESADITSTSDLQSTDKTVNTSIKLKRVKIKSLKSKKGGNIKVSLKKVKTASGYRIRFADNKKFKGYKQKNTKKRTYTIKKFKGKKCFVKVRAYIKSDDGKTYGAWSKIKKVQVKR